MAASDESILVDEETVKLVVDLLHEAAEPQTLAKIRSQLPAGSWPFPEADLERVLEQQEASGHLFRFAPYRSDGARFWAKPVDTYATQVILAELRDTPLSLAALDKKIAARLADCPLERRRQILDELLMSGQIHQLPQQPGERAITFRSGTPDLVAYYGPAVSEFAARARAITEQLQALHVPIEQCWAAIDELLDAELFTAGTLRTKPLAAATEPASEPPAAEPDIRTCVLDWIAEATKLHRRGGLISVRELREAMLETEPDKAAFDACILDLAQAGQLWLYRHDYAASLSPAEREALVRDTKGNYYNGVSLRT